MSRPTSKCISLVILCATTVGAITACDEFECRESTVDIEVHTQSIPTSDIEQYYYRDGSGRLSGAFKIAAIPRPARAAVIIDRGDADRLPEWAVYTADLSDTSPEANTIEARLSSSASVRVTSYSAHAGHRTGEIVHETSRVLAERHPASEANKAAREKRKALEKEHGGQLPVDAADVSLSNLDHARRIRTVWAQRPRPAEFSIPDGFEPGTTVVFERDGCMARDAKGGSIRHVDVATSTGAASLRQMARLAEIEPAVPARWVTAPQQEEANE